jgi:hypothetical protein
MSVTASELRLPAPPSQARPDLRFFSIAGKKADAGLTASRGGGWFWLTVEFGSGGGALGIGLDGQRAIRPRRKR